MSTTPLMQLVANLCLVERQPESPDRERDSDALYAEIERRYVAARDAGFTETGVSIADILDGAL